VPAAPKAAREEYEQFLQAVAGLLGGDLASEELQEAAVQVCWGSMLVALLVALLVASSALDPACYVWMLWPSCVVVLLVVVFCLSRLHETGVCHKWLPAGNS
jgi:fatty acid desaturase